LVEPFCKDTKIRQKQQNLNTISFIFLVSPNWSMGDVAANVGFRGLGFRRHVRLKPSRSG
jgi:hypothetical protein